MTVTQEILTVDEKYERCHILNEQFNEFSHMHDYYIEKFYDGNALYYWRHVYLPREEAKQRERQNIAAQKNKFFFITINPDNSQIRIRKFLQKIASICNRAFVEKYYYTIEQRGKTMKDMGQGFHAHLIIFPKYNKKKKCLAEIQRDIYSTCKNFTGNIKHIDVKEYPIEFLDDKIKYLKGEKFEEDKLESCKINAAFRKKNNIDILYTNASEIFSG